MAITPARNEVSNLERLAESLERQTWHPVEWIIVDDGSTDGTYAVATSLAARCEWVTPLSSPGPNAKSGPLEQGRRDGRDIIAFNAGVAAVETLPDVIVKLDADVSVEPDYFARLVAKFEEEPSLGIASGTCYELVNGSWKPYHVTGGHVRGATRAYRRECFLEVAPLEDRLGWDGIDEARANILGWTTQSFRDLGFLHHRPLGSRDGARGAWMMQGELAHVMGHRAWYVALRSIFRAVREPAALALIVGYCRAKWRGIAKYPDAEVRAHIRRQQTLMNLPRRAGQVLGRLSV
jgi:glycosyltransferase involved in cell wall biosynthesis